MNVRKCVSERAPLYLLNKVRRILPALKFRGEWSHGPWCWVLWPVLLPFCFSSTSLSFAMCRPHACMKNWRWLFRNLGVFLRFPCVDKKGALDLAALLEMYRQRIKFADHPCPSPLWTISEGVFSHLFFFFFLPRNTSKLSLHRGKCKIRKMFAFPMV